MSTDHFDLAIIGSGSAAFSAAIRASELGARVAMVERGIVGGTCVNVGCIPSKAELAAAAQRHRAADNPFPGVSTSAHSVDLRALVAGKDAIVRSLRQERYLDLIEHYGAPPTRACSPPATSPPRPSSSTSPPPWAPPRPRTRSATASGRSTTPRCRGSPSPARRSPPSGSPTSRQACPLAHELDDPACRARRAPAAHARAAASGRSSRGLAREPPD